MESSNGRAFQIIGQITSAFASVSREGGVSLHQTRVLDDGGSLDDGGLEEMMEAAAKDVDTDWREVPDSAIEKPDLSLNFLDTIGFRYYLPAYIIWQLKQDAGLVPWVDCNTHGTAFYSLELHKETDLREWQEERFRMFTPEQARAINRFLHFYVQHGDDFERENAQEILDGYWDKYD